MQYGISADNLIEEEAQSVFNSTVRASIGPLKKGAMVS